VTIEAGKETGASNAGIRPLLWGLIPVIMLLSSAAPADRAPEELVVTSSRGARPLVELTGNTALIPADGIARTNHQHVHELLVQASGTWVTRGTGQEHLTAIRSPVLTGPGACGAFLVLEDGIPTRPTGFCNVNQIFEIPTEMASRVEVLRGPANALYGSNGLHGTLNFLLPAPGVSEGWSAGADAGPDQFRRGRVQFSGVLGGADVAGGVLADDYGGFRDESGYDQQKLYLRGRRDLTGGELRFGISASNLDQETASFVRGQDAYRDDALRKTNPNPEAFRKADSQRAFVQWIPGTPHPFAGGNVRAYLRRSDMEFLQHFLPGQPLEENGQVSGGLMISMTRAWRETSSWTAGIDVEAADGFLKEFQANDIGSATRPRGLHYDYDVVSAMVSPYAQLQFDIADDWSVQAGLRFEYLRYDYETNLLAGNTRDDGTPCVPGGCLFNRPADRDDDFANLAPNVGLRYALSPDSAIYLAAARGYRAPQVTELYRLQSGRTVADLDSETLDSIEIGYHRRTAALSFEAVAFAMEKRDYIFRDADGFNISDGRSRHAGIELQADIRFESGLYGSLAGTFARHTYEFDRDAARGELIRDGNDVDTAPKTLASARIGIDRGQGLAELEWVHQGGHYLNAANTARYGGHNLLNLRLLWQLDPHWSVGARISNLGDERYADRADFAFGNYRYFPGREREILLQIAWRE